MSVQAEHQIVVDYNVPAMMRDGITLRANIYRPAGEGKWPVLLTRLPYNKDLAANHVMINPLNAARHGYVVVIQDTRGRFASEGAGDWDFLSALSRESLDGCDTIVWAATLPYSNGRVGMFGESYFAFTQWAAMFHSPEALRVAAPAQVPHDPLKGLFFRGGAFELGMETYYYLGMHIYNLVRRHQGNPEELKAALDRLRADMDELAGAGFWSLPLKQFAPARRNGLPPSFFAVMEHGMERGYFDQITLATKWEALTVPTLNIAGWYDLHLQGTIDNFTNVRTHGRTPEARQSKLLIGPWSHGNYTSQVGDLSFGSAAEAGFSHGTGDLWSYQMRWFDHWLKGIDTGVMDEAPIQLFVMGANVWRAEQEWPPARAVATRYYLHSNGDANTLYGDGVLSTTSPGTEEPDHYFYDPNNPVPTHGGAIGMPAFLIGPRDQTAIEGRSDVLAYTTPVLDRDVEVTGPISVRLWAVSSAPDTDFVARLVDVHPNGYAQNLADGIIRARYRNYHKGEPANLIEPGKAYEYEIDLWSTSNLFRKGHRIRLDITSSCFPRWDRNPNTGHDFGADSEVAVARQTILHDENHPSYVLLPIIPTV